MRPASARDVLRPNTLLVLASGTSSPLFRYLRDMRELVAGVAALLVTLGGAGALDAAYGRSRGSLRGMKLRLAFLWLWRGLKRADAKVPPTTEQRDGAAKALASVGAGLGTAAALWGWGSADARSVGLLLGEFTSAIVVGGVVFGICGWILDRKLLRTGEVATAPPSPIESLGSASATRDDLYRFFGSAEVDQFGVPQNVFGPLPDEFWGGLGRVIGLTALLEDQMRTLLEALALTPSGTHRKKGPTELVEALREELRAVEDSDWAAFSTYLEAAASKFEYRNHLAHNLWSAQPGGEAFGHRVNRRGTEGLSTTTSLEELRDKADGLVELVEPEWRRWFALAGVLAVTRQRERHRAQPPETPAGDGATA